MTITAKDSIPDDVILTNVDWELWEVMLASEPILEREWLSSAEDEAWADV